MTVPPDTPRTVTCSPLAVVAGVTVAILSSLLRQLICRLSASSGLAVAMRWIIPSERIVNPPVTSFPAVSVSSMLFTLDSTVTAQLAMRPGYSAHVAVIVAVPLPTAVIRLPTLAAVAFVVVLSTVTTLVLSLTQVTVKL